MANYLGPDDGDSPDEHWSGSAVQAPSSDGRRTSRLRRWFSSAVAILLKAKLLLVILSMFASMLLYGLAFGWPFGVGLVLLIAVHELGHVVAIRQRGMKATLPIFIPFMGALVGLQQQPQDAEEEAYIGIAGPVFGMAAACFCWWLGYRMHSELLLLLASFGMIMHIFNLMPVVPLDGGRTVAFLRWKAWAPGLLAMLVLLFYDPVTHAITFDPFAILILAFVLYNFRARLLNPPSPLYDQIALSTKWLYGGVWFGLLGLAVYGYLRIPLHVGI